MGSLRRTSYKQVEFSLQNEKMVPLLKAHTALPEDLSFSASTQCGSQPALIPHLRCDGPLLASASTEHM